MPAILLFSGPMASGKTTLANELIARAAFKRLKSSDFLKADLKARGEIVSRSALQRLGDTLDEKTDYRWLIDNVATPQMAADPEQPHWIIDSVRKKRQVFHFRTKFATDVFHVHVWAPDELLKRRFHERLGSADSSEGSTSYTEAISHPNEVSARALREIADLSIDLSAVELGDAVASILAFVAGRE